MYMMHASIYTCSKDRTLTHVCIYVYIFVGLSWFASTRGCTGDSIRGSFYLYASWGVPLVVDQIYIFFDAFIYWRSSLHVHIMCISVPWWHTHVLSLFIWLLSILVVRYHHMYVYMTFYIFLHTCIYLRFTIFHFRYI